MITQENEKIKGITKQELEEELTRYEILLKIAKMLSDAVKIIDDDDLCIELISNYYITLGCKIAITELLERFK